MSDIRFNQWLHQSGTGGVSQSDGGHVGIGTTNPLIPVGAGNTHILNVGVVTCNNISAGSSITAGTFYGSGSQLTGVSGVSVANQADNRLITVTGTTDALNGEANLNFDGTNLKIGSTGTEGALSIRGSANSTQVMISDHTSATLRIATASGALSQYFVEAGQSIVFGHGSNSGLSNERLRINSSGRVGINTTSDTFDGVTGNLNIANTNLNNYTVINLSRNTTSDRSQIRFSNPNGNVGSIDTSVSDLIIRCANDLRFDTNSNERIRIASSGNVHIGSGSPTIAKLQVSGAGFFGSANTTKTNDGVIIERNSNDGLAHITAGRSGGNYSGFDFYVAGASGVTKRYSIDYQSNFRWYAANGTTERAKITNDGYSKFTSNGTYDGYSNALQAHEFRQSLNKPTLWCSNTSTAQTWEIYRAETARSNNSAFGFISCTSGNLSDDEFRVRGDGNVYADGTFNPNGADYAEYFEWTDGNSSNEDRRGMTVVLDGNKIKVSTSSDSTDNIIGVVSGNASVIGDSSWNKWSDKYLKDDYGTYQRDENGERKLNPSFDDTKTYVSREDRQEWDAIGMIGKLRIRKGQTTGTRWIKMRDISDTVEEWLVR